MHPIMHPITDTSFTQQEHYNNSQNISSGTLRHILESIQAIATHQVLPIKNVPLTVPIV